MSVTKHQSDIDIALIAALFAGNHDLAGYVLEQGANPNATGVSDIGVFTPALELSLYQPADVRFKLIKALMAHGADPNSCAIPDDAKRYSKASPFLRACMRQDEISAGAMLDSLGPIKVDLLARDQFGWIPSMAAIESSPAFLSKMQSFFERETMPSRPELGRDHLWSCLDHEGRNSSMLCINMPTSLQWLSSQDYIDFTKLINTKEARSGETALWAAARKHNQSSVDFLLRHGADATIVNSKGESLLSYLENECGSSYQNNRHLLPLKVSIKDCVKAAASAQMAMASIEEMLCKVIHRGQKVAS